MNQSPRRRVLSRLAPAGGVLVGLAGIAFVARTLVTRWDEVSDAFSRASATPLVASVLVGLAAMTVIGTVWVGLLRSRGHHAPWSTAMSWYYVGQLGKYVPGGVWPIVGRAELAVRGGVPRASAYSATAYSLVTTYAAATVTVVIGSLLAVTHLWIGAALAVCLAVAWYALGSAPFSRIAVALAAKVTSRTLVLPDRGQFVRLTVAHVPAWVLMSLSTTVTAHAFGARIGSADMLFVTSLSWLIGFVVVGVPGGIGVRESVFTALAGGMVGTPVALSLALVSRVVFIAVDLAGALVSTMVAAATRSRRRASAEV